MRFLYWWNWIGPACNIPYVAAHQIDSETTLSAHKKDNFNTLVHLNMSFKNILLILTCTSTINHIPWQDGTSFPLCFIGVIVLSKSAITFKNQNFEWLLSMVNTQYHNDTAVKNRYRFYPIINWDKYSPSQDITKLSTLWSVIAMRGQLSSSLLRFGMGNFSFINWRNHRHQLINHWRHLPKESDSGCA